MDAILFNQQLDFINEMDLLKSVKRKALVKSDNNRFENSAEHSWHIAMAAHIFKEYAEQEVDINRVTQMLLIHDIVEIDAGDTFAFASQAELNKQAEIEDAAAKRIFGLLPESQRQHFYNLFIEFENAKTPDSKYAKAIDRILPLLQNIRNEGGSWAQHTVRKSQVLARNQVLADIAPKLWSFVQQQVEYATEKGWLVNE